MINVNPDFAVCSECGGQLKVIVWGEGIDSSVRCTGCDKKEIYR